MLAEEFDQAVFDVEVVQLDGSAAVVLRGELDVATAPRLEAKASEAAARLPPGAQLVLDFTRLEFIDAAGLAVIARLASQVGRNGGKVSVASARPWTCRIFEITGLGCLLRRPPVSSS